MRNDGVAETGYVDAFLEDGLAHGERLRGLPDDDRHNRVRAVGDPEAGFRHRLAEVRRVLAQLAHGRRIFAQHPEGFERAGRDGGRQGVGKERRAAPLPQRLDQGLRPGREASGGGAHRLAERAGRHIDPVHHALLFRRPPAGRAEHAGGVRVVYGEEDIIVMADPSELPEICLFPLHREDSVGHHEAESRGRVLGEHLFERLRVAVGDAVALGLAETHAVDDRGVVELVGVEAVGLVQDRGEQPFVRVPAGHVQDRVVGRKERGDLGLELLVELLGPADEPHRRHARAPPVDRLLLRLAHARVVGEPQIVVRGQHDDLAPADFDARVLRRLEDQLLLVGAGLSELLHLTGEILDELVHVSSRLSF